MLFEGGSTCSADKKTRKVRNTQQVPAVLLRMVDTEALDNNDGQEQRADAPELSHMHELYRKTYRNSVSTKKRISGG